MKVIMAQSSGRRSKPNGVTLLRGYLRNLSHLTAVFQRSRDARVRKRTAIRMLKEVSAYAKVKKDICFAALRSGRRDKEMALLLDQAIQEHHLAKLLAAKIQAPNATDGQHTENVMVIAASIRQHLR
ncbi:MAG TPA: hypothetical protein VJ692_05730, partial [Nitrospiraceae bacterium]|nr:hypothetical protein [Nitrospiraceae bacterium]